MQNIGQAEAGGGCSVMNEKCCCGGMRHKSRTSAKRQKSNVRQNEASESHCRSARVDVGTQDCINWGQRDTGVIETWNESFICADRPGWSYLRDVIQKVSARIVSHATVCSDAQQTGWPGVPEKGWGIWEERLRALFFITVEIEPKTSSKQVIKINLSYCCNWGYCKERHRRRWRMGRATGRACIISILSFKEYTDDDKIGDGRTTKSI